MGAVNAISERNLFSRCLAMKKIMKLRLELERGEVLRQALQREISVTKKAACIQMYSAEDELCELKTKLVELQGNYKKKKKKLWTRGYLSPKSLKQAET